MSKTNDENGEPTLDDREIARLRSAIEAAALGTWEWEIQSGAVRFNERWAEIVGYRLEELEPTSIATWERLANAEDLQLSNELLERHWSGELEVYECECRMLHRDGHWVWVLDRGKVTEWDDEGKPLRMAGTHQDITELKRVDAERMELRQRLEDGERLQSVGRLAGGVAHDFNNLLAVISGNLHFAMQELDEGHPAVEHIAGAAAAVKRSAELTAQLVDFSRARAAPIESIAVHEVLRRVVQGLRPSLGSGMEIRFELNASDDCVRLPGQQLERVVSNLLSNAGEAMQGQGCISLSTRIGEPKPLNNVEGGDYLILDVRDDGPGISEEHLRRVFEPYFTTKAQRGGTGLGLSVVYGLASQWGGTVSVASVEGQGTVFSVWIPRGTELTADVSSARLAVVTGRPHVLVVEDEVELLGLIESMLVAAGFKVTACSDPAAALEQVLKGSPPPDLLLSDMRMPGMGGHALLAKVRERLPEIRAGFMSGFAHAEGSGEGLAIEVLQKPFSQGQLLAYVEEQLGRAAPPES